MSIFCLFMMFSISKCPCESSLNSYNLDEDISPMIKGTMFFKQDTPTHAHKRQMSSRQLWSNIVLKAA